jgi:hypothetical protein
MNYQMGLNAKRSVAYVSINLRLQRGVNSEIKYRDDGYPMFDLAQDDKLVFLMHHHSMETLDTETVPGWVKLLFELAKCDLSDELVDIVFISHHPTRNGGGDDTQMTLLQAFSRTPEGAYAAPALNEIQSYGKIGDEAVPEEAFLKDKAISYFLGKYPPGDDSPSGTRFYEQIAFVLRHMSEVSRDHIIQKLPETYYGSYSRWKMEYEKKKPHWLL